MKWSMVFTERQRLEGEILPPWYMGLGYTDWSLPCQYWYVLPLNYIVRAGVWIRWKWDKFRSRRSWVDRQVTVLAEKMATADRNRDGLLALECDALLRETERMRKQLQEWRGLGEYAQVKKAVEMVKSAVKSAQEMRQ